MAQVAGQPPYPGAQPPGPPAPAVGGYHTSRQQQPQPAANAGRPRQQPGPGQPQPQQAHRHSSSHHARPPRQQQQGSKQRPPPAAGGGSRHASQQQQQQSAAARGPVVLPSIAADNMEDLEQLRRQTPFMCNVKFGNSLPEIPSDPKLITATYEPDRLSKFFLTTVEQQPRRELLLPADVGVPISVLDLERYDIPDDLGPRPKLDPADEVLLQDVEGLPSGAGGSSSSIRDVKRSKKGEVSWLMSTTYLTSGGEPVAKRGAAAGGPGGRFQMGSSSSQQPQELTREQQLADIEATFAAARAYVPRHHPTKPGVTAERVVPILPDVESWPNKYVVVQFPEGDPAHDSRTLAKIVKPEHRRELLSHSLLKSYQTQASAQGAGGELTVGLLVPHDLAETAIAGGKLPEEQSPEDMAGDYSWDCEYNFDLLQNDPAGPQPQLLLMLQDDKVGYCNLDGSLKLRKRKRQPNDEPRPAKAVVENRDYHENEIAERQDRVATIDPGAVDVDPDVDFEDAGEDDMLGVGVGVGGAGDMQGVEEDEGLQEDGEEGAEQGGLGYQ